MPELAGQLAASAVPADAVVALLVDDDRSFVQFAREELNQTSGPPVCLLHAASLHEAGEMLAEWPVAVVLLNRWLPDGDGLEWLRVHGPGIQAGVLMLTRGGAGEPSPLVLGAQDLLVKPHIDGDHLARAIRYAAERERTRQQLLKSRAHFQSLIEHASDLMTVVDRQGCVLYQSPSAAILLGTAPNAHHGATFPELVHPEDAGRARHLIEEVFTRGSTPRGEFRLPHVDGSMRTFDVIASSLHVDEGAARAVLHGRDITERVRAEEALRVREHELRQAQKMEAVGRLAGGIAHDFSNVLTVIAGVCERLRDDIQHGSARPQDVDMILRHCARATALTKQLLAFSRQQTIAPRVVNLIEVVDRVRELIVQMVGAGVRFEVEADPGLHPIDADPVQMEQVLMNLAVNARDAMPDGGEIRVVLRNVTVTAAKAALHPPMRPGDYVRLDVIDTGCGMSADTMARAFEPFFTTKDSTRGTGLGLSTVYGIVTQNRGTVWIDSAPGRGTRFEIHLPVSSTRSTQLRAVERTSPVARSTTRTILVTEDDADLRELLTETLASRNYVVLEAAGPQQAIQVATAQPAPIDLLLTDLVMPGGSGRYLARELTSRWPDLKVLYTSGYPETGPGTAGAVLEPGDPFLPKPFTRQQLLHAIESLFD